MAKEKGPKMEKIEQRTMTLEEARADRATRYAPKEKPLTEQQKREQFRIFWAQTKRQYGKTKALEEIVWLHLMSSGHSNPKDFEAGLQHFGLKKLSN